jgi:hypothetical protein
MLMLLPGLSSTPQRKRASLTTSGTRSARRNTCVRSSLADCDYRVATALSNCSRANEASTPQRLEATHAGNQLSSDRITKVSNANAARVTQSTVGISRISSRTMYSLIQRGPLSRCVNDVDLAPQVHLASLRCLTKSAACSRDADKTSSPSSHREITCPGSP